MARLTQATLKYMGAVKDSTTPPPDVIVGYANDLQQISNDLYSKLNNWKRDADLNRLLPLLQANYDSKIGDIFAAMLNQSFAFDDKVSDFGNAMREIAKKVGIEDEKNKQQE